MIATTSHETARAAAMAAHRDLTRRDFLAAAGVGLIACARASSSFSQPSSSPPPDELLLYVGTYTENTKSEGIYL
ncbi:MAG TPA: twin-arginine translocation signal domain-containing protein, partial [Gemmatimonadaceae bacterium]|nr:twin-arginine translocation signal domain-containing protein [Gemmatimonadaceae bacterium]